jgi:prepilin-type N-terminal cleavage/methylation domain-containing protein
MSATARFDEAGVTLIELLITVALMGIVMVALASALFVGFRTTQDTNTSLDQSNAEQLVSLYLTRDVQGADTVAGSVTSPCGSEPVLLETQAHSDPLMPASNVTVTYRLSGNNLIRRVCGPTPSTQTLARNIATFTPSGTAGPTVRVDVGTLSSADVPAYAWTLEVRRRQA